MILRHIFLACAVVLAFSGMAQAQVMLGTGSQQTETTPTLPDPLTPEAANALISRLSDGEVRALLLDQLNTQAAKVDAQDDNRASEFFYHATTGAWSSVIIPFQKLGDLFTGQARAFSTFYEKIGHGRGLLILLGYMVLVYGAGALAELAFRRFTSGWRVLPPADPDNMTLRETLQLLMQRFGTQVVAVLVFIIVARTVGQIILPENLFPFVQLFGIYLIAFPRVMLAVAFFFFAPMNPEYRLLNVSTNAARAFCFHQFWLAMLLGFSAAIQTFNATNGVTMGETRIGFWLNLAMHIYLIVIFWKYRADGVTMMRGADPDVTPAEERAARLYPYMNIFMFVAIWWIINIVVSYGNFELLRSAPHYKTMILLMFAPAMDTAIRGLVRHLTPAMSGEGPVAEKAYYATKRSYIRVGRVVIFAGVILSIANFWGMSPTAIATAGIGARLAANGLEFLIILSIGYVLYECVSLFINRKLAAEYTASGYDPDNEEIGGGDGGGAGGSRLSTVLPLILGVARATIVVIFVLLALGNVGVDTTPLLAGAGIVGLAIGFGAQKLVSDVVSGVFFLIDDAFRTGEYVEVEGTMGTVEKISIRSMQLRHHKGPVHTLPYGEIPKITNFSRDWVIMKLRFTVPFDTDPNMVKKIFKKIGQEMLEVPEFKEDFLQPFKSQGMLEIDDVGMVFRGKFMAKPGTQFTLRKEIFNRVNKAFAENGLEFARREVRVALPSMDSKNLSEEDKSTIAAAATQAAQEMVPEGGPKDDR